MTNQGPKDKPTYEGRGKNYLGGDIDYSRFPKDAAYIAVAHVEGAYTQGRTEGYEVGYAAAQQEALLDAQERGRLAIAAASLANESDIVADRLQAQQFRQQAS